MKITGKTSIIVLLLLGEAFFSCSSQIAGTLKEGGTADFLVSTSLQPRMTALIRSFQLMLGSGGGGELILDGAAISQSMAAAPGMGEVSLANTAPAALEGRVELSRVGDFLAVAGRERRFITYTENTGDGHGRIVISLDRDNAPEVITLLSADAAAYLSALMAPAATGEVLSRREYLALVGSLYGQAIADEINTAKINASIDFPGTVTAIRGGSSSGRRALFEVPLLDILVLDNPLVWEITWAR